MVLAACHTFPFSLIIHTSLNALISHATPTVSNLEKIRTGNGGHAVENGVSIYVIGVYVIDEVPHAFGVRGRHIHRD